MGDNINNKVDIPDLTRKAESSDSKEQDALHATLDKLNPKEVREAMAAMVAQNYKDRHDASGKVIPGVPELSIKFEDTNPGKAEALNKTEERAYLDPRRLWGDHLSTSEAYRPADETSFGKVQAYIQGLVAQINPLQPVVDALDKANNPKH